MNISRIGRDFLRSICNLHRQREKKNIFLLATPRGGSTWVMEIIASQPRMKYYDEPFNIRRANVQKTGVFTTWEQLMPGTADREQVFAYIRALERNRYRFLNPAPLRKNHRFLTDRIVYKVHELAHMAGDIEQELGGQIVYLLRHPISTTISRVVYPRLDAYLTSAYFRDRYLSDTQYLEIHRLATSGSKLQKGMVAWCYENLVPLKHSNPTTWLVITYEEIVLNPVKSCRLMFERLRLTDLNALIVSVDEPASNIVMSDAGTRALMKGPDDTRRRLGLVRKWTTKVRPEEERQAFDVMDLFGLDAYRYGRLVAHDRYLNFGDTIQHIATP